MMEKTIRWGLIGAGDVCERKGGPPLYELPRHTLLAVTRRNADAGRDYASRHNQADFEPDMEALLAREDIDAVYVATPPHVHAEQAIACARAGKQVLVEKPMAMHARECESMVAVCIEENVTLGVAFYRRCYPSILRSAELIRTGRIGTLTEIEINDEFPISHRLDLMHFFAGDFLEVWSEEGNLPMGSHAKRGPRLYGETVNGVNVRTNIGWQESGAPEQVRLTGTKGEVFVRDLKGGSIEIRDNHQSTDVEREVFEPLPWTHWGLVNNFGLALAGSADLACSGEEGRKSTVVLDFVSGLRPGAGPEAVDYDKPPSPDTLASKGMSLLA